MATPTTNKVPVQVIHVSLVRLTTEDRKRAPKMRAGAGEIVRLVLELAEKMNLNVTKASVADVRRDVLVAERLKPLKAVVDELQELLDDTILQAPARVTSPRASSGTGGAPPRRTPPR